MTITRTRENIGVTRPKARPSTSQLMKEFMSNYNCRGLLRFFVVHPNGRFSKLAIVHNIDDCDSRLDVEQALTYLVNEGIIETSVENNTCYYLLTREQPIRELVMNLSEFDWNQWQRLDNYYIANRRVSA